MESRESVRKLEDWLLSVGYGAGLAQTHYEQHKYEECDGELTTRARTLIRLRPSSGSSLTRPLRIRIPFQRLSRLAQESWAERSLLRPYGPLRDPASCRLAQAMLAGRWRGLRA